jgi:hypothetical protein
MKNPSDKDWKSMESEWREKIQEEISPVPEGLWEKVSLRLDAEEKSKVFFIKNVLPTRRLPMTATISASLDAKEANKTACSCALPIKFLPAIMLHLTQLSAHSSKKTCYSGR